MKKLFAVIAVVCGLGLNDNTAKAAPPCTNTNAGEQRCFPDASSAPNPGEPGLYLCTLIGGWPPVPMLNPYAWIPWGPANRPCTTSSRRKMRSPKS